MFHLCVAGFQHFLMLSDRLIFSLKVRDYFKRPMHRNDVSKSCKVLKVQVQVQ